MNFWTEEQPRSIAVVDASLLGVLQEYHSKKAGSGVIMFERNPNLVTLAGVKSE